MIGHELVVAVTARWLDLPAPEHDPDEVRTTAREILARREFQPPSKSTLERIVDWIGRQLDRLFGRLGPGQGGSRALTWLLLLAAVGAVVWLAYRTVRDRGRWRRPGEEAGADVTVEETPPSSEWRAEADRLEAAGRWKDALRCRYRALVQDLVEAGVVADVAGRTTGEYRNEVATALPDVAPAFSDATELFERAWYGDRATGAAESERFRDVEAGVLTGAGTRA